MEGTVLKSTGSWYQVLSADGVVVSCRIKGAFRTQGIKSTNPIAVGDRVSFFYEEGQQDKGIIDQLFERRNYIIRKSVNLSKQVHIIASNIDVVIIVATLKSPRTSLGFIDRMLVTAEAYHIKPIIVFNKVDLYAQEQMEYLNQCREMYADIGYQSFFVSAFDAASLAILKDNISGKEVLFSGHSGVGKSTLINAIYPALRLKTGDISNFSNKGKHTTTFAEMFPVEGGGFIVDSPGIKEMGIVDIEPQELGRYFPEFRQFSPMCKFHNCKHINEPSCEVLRNVEEGIIPLTRYDSYQSMLLNQDSRA